MSLHLCILASGSSGNAILLWTPEGAILVDAGISAKQLKLRIAGTGVDPSSIQAVVLTHEHSDHVCGVSVFARQLDIPVYANAGTAEALLQRRQTGDIRFKIFSTGSSFSISGMELTPFPIPHDACEPVGFVVRSGECKAAVATDIGMPTTLLRTRLRDCDALVLESNHDEDMLRNSDRPWAMKQRILGRQGHLSNEATGELLREIASARLRQVFLAHLSEDCNTHDLALMTARRALAAAGQPNARVDVARPDQISPIWSWSACAAK